jgi:UDP-N-acetylglucosamine 4,6-dehydratase
MAKPITGRILITGGTGSLGHALVAHWLKTTDHRLIVFSRDEKKQADMREEFPDGRLDFFLGDVRDLPRLKLAFAASVDVVVHAAALKRVDSVCHDPDEVLKTNVLGSRNVLNAARGQVAQCLLISSDKACYATNAYGVSKAYAEHLFTAFNVYGIPQGTASSVVRYGNVLGSRGSVIPLWRAQLAQGLPLTLTDPRMTRFLIDFARAIQMIDTALAEMRGGEIFVPRLKAAAIVHLANVVQPLPGPRAFTGLRPGGEKLHETLLTDEEYERARWGKDYAMIPPELHPWTAKGWGKGTTWPVDDWRRSDIAPRWELDELRALVAGI